MKSTLTILLFALGLFRLETLTALVGRDLNIVSNIVACGDGLISGGATVICVQSTILKTGCSGTECELPSGKTPSDSSIAALAITADGARRTSEHIAKKIAHAQTAHQRPVEQLEITYDRVPTVSLKNISKPTKTSLYLPALKSSILYTFTPTTGQAAHTPVEILLKTDLADKRDYQEADKLSNYNEDDQNLEIYERIGNGLWIRVGLITAINQEILDAAQAINGAGAQLPELTINTNGSIEIPVAGQAPKTFDLVDLYFDKHSTETQPSTNTTPIRPSNQG